MCLAFLKKLLALQRPCGMHQKHSILLDDQRRHLFYISIKKWESMCQMKTVYYTKWEARLIYYVLPKSLFTLPKTFLNPLKGIWGTAPLFRTSIMSQEDLQRFEFYNLFHILFIYVHDALGRCIICKNSHQPYGKFQSDRVDQSPQAYD